MKRAALITSSIAIVASVAALALAGGGFSAFQASPPAVWSPLSTATVAISLSSTGSTGSLSVGAQNLVPGDTVQREVKLSNTGTAPIGAVTLAATVSPSNLLSTDTTDGLQVEAQTCSTAWTATSLADGGYTYACSGPVTSVIAREPIGSLASSTPLTAVGSIPVSGSANLVITVSLPSTAGNTYQGMTTTIDYTFVATQAAGGNA